MAQRDISQTSDIEDDNVANLLPQLIKKFDILGMITGWFASLRGGTNMIIAYHVRSNPPSCSQSAFKEWKC